MDGITRSHIGITGEGNRVDEHEWLTSTDPAMMLRWATRGDLWAYAKPGDVPRNPFARKLRLFACACCRLWGTLRDREGAYDHYEKVGHRVGGAVVSDLEWAMAWIGGGGTTVSAIHKGVDRGTQAALLRDIFGNQWKPVTIKEIWRLQTAGVVSIAEDIYEKRRWQAMPILADALEESGCTERAILEHLRKPQHKHHKVQCYDDPLTLFCETEEFQHVRGCHVLDLVLGKE